MLPRLRYFFAQAVNGLWRSLGVTALAVVTIAMALGLLATFAIVLDNLARVADDLGREVGLSAYLAAGVAEPELRARAEEVAAWPEVAEAKATTSTAAMVWLREALGEDAVVLDGLSASVLPPSIEVRLVPRVWSGAAVARVARRLESVAGIEDVRYGQEDVERVHAMLGVARVAALAVGLALCLAAILIVSNTIRLAVYARRDEIEILSLIGATNAFVRAPFVIEGALQGMFGGLLAAGALVLTRHALTEGLRRGLAYAYAPIELMFAPVEVAGALLAVGLMLGLLGSALAVGKFIRV